MKMVHECHEKHKEKLQKESRERYKNFSEKEKEEKQKKSWSRYQNLSEIWKEKSVSIIMNVIKPFLKMEKKMNLSILKLLVNIYLWSWFVDFSVPGAILFDGLVFEILGKFLNFFVSLKYFYYKVSLNS